MKKSDKLKKLKLDAKTIKPLGNDQLLQVVGGLGDGNATTTTCPPCR